MEKNVACRGEGSPAPAHTTQCSYEEPRYPEVAPNSPHASSSVHRISCCCRLETKLSHDEHTGWRGQEATTRSMRFVILIKLKNS